MYLDECKGNLVLYHTSGVALNVEVLYDNRHHVGFC